MFKFITTACVSLCLSTGAFAQDKKLLTAPLASPKNVLWMTASVSPWNTKGGDIYSFTMCRLEKGGMVDLNCRSGKGYSIALRGSAFDKNQNPFKYKKQRYYTEWSKPNSTGQHAFTWGKNGRHKFFVTDETMVANIQPGTIVVNKRYATSKAEQKQAMAKAKEAAIANFGDVAKNMKVVFMAPRAVSCDTKKSICKLK